MVSFVPQTDLPAAAHPGTNYSRGVGVHGAARSLATFPAENAVCRQLNFISGLTQSAGALPG